MSTTPNGSDFRPSWHFAPARFWMNDPNGLVFLDGEYHLFYQYNPTANDWGQIGWGHAVSRDLIHWNELPEALPATEQGMVFTGSAVVDFDNSSGLAEHDAPAIVAIYTCDSSTNGNPSQTQHIAWSEDQGRNWRRYHGNPVIDIGTDSFRDPKVFWHTDSERWIMAVALSSERQVRIYASINLLQWNYLSSFGPCGYTVGEWECPDLFPLPLENEPERVKWVLKVDSSFGALAGGSGGQYFIGEFDGTRFQADQTPTASQEGAEGVRRFDYGSDFYAAMTWSNLPAAAGRRVWLGWMSNLHYAGTTPTHPWRGAQSSPRSLHLASCAGGLQLIQRPVEELTRLRGRHRRWHDVDLAAGKSFLLEGSDSETLELAIQLDLAPDTLVALHLGRSNESVTTVGFDNQKSELFVDRWQTSAAIFHPDFPGCHRGPLPAKDGQVEIRLLLDHCCLEVFGGQGETVISDLIFPDGTARGINVACERGAAVVRQLDLWQLGP